MYVYYNPNPLGLSVGDCTIRAISCALSIPWEETYASLANLGFEMRLPMYTMGMGGNSNMRGYSRHGDMEEMKQELKEMMNEAQDVKVKEAIQKVLNEMNK